MTQQFPSVHYIISHDEINTHTFCVKIVIPTPDKNGQVLSLPAWIPGSYLVRDFCKHIGEFSAKNSNGDALSYSKLDKQRWKVEPCQQSIEIDYKVYAFDYSVRGAYLDQEFGFFNGTSVFMQVEGQQEQAVAVTLNQSQHAKTHQWKVATSLPLSDTTPLYAFGEYQAPDYQALIDHPVMMGNLDLIQFEQHGIQFDMVFVGAASLDKQRIADDVSKLCDHHLSMFSNGLDIDRYVFMTMVTDNGFGGLEHRASTALICGRNDLPSPTDNKEISENYRTFLSLCSHEFFHSWLVKRIRPQEHINANLSREAYTEQLWIFEGITSYFDDYALVRSGVVSQESYLELLGQMLTRVHRNLGKFKQTVTESSFDAWTRFYQQDENANNAIVSYYSKGAIIALCLDLYIRQNSEQKLTLVELMQTLWREYGLTPNGTHPRVIHDLCTQMGIDADNLLNQMLYSTDPLPVDNLLNQQGIEVNYQAANNYQDKGGKKLTSAIKHQFGATYNAEPSGVKITSVLNDSPASKAGLAKGDVLVALGEWQITASNLQSLIDKLTAKTTLLVFRRGKLLKLTFSPVAALKDSIYLTVKDKDLADKWLAKSI
ncbi:M61 family metallopeptidase [Neptunicella marina]|uniref:M61 family metallopeptidase n=1 Tax=Neptunicella marina TaxID=2125989 RepID=A0A8J6IS55_9ALTE|nr:PDZ domain-containing protein [Neptunicella marina]MBC3764598.1 M61 family metallopeptidase [Neptunicella marina]